MLHGGTPDFLGITKATYVVGEDYQEGRQAADDIKALGKHTSVSDLQLLITSRSSWEKTTYVMHALDTLPYLRHLQVLNRPASICFATSACYVSVQRSMPALHHLPDCQQ